MGLGLRILFFYFPAYCGRVGLKEEQNGIVMWSGEWWRWTKNKNDCKFLRKNMTKKATQFYIIFIAITVNCAKIYLDNRHFAQNLQCACFSLLAHNNAIIKWFLITWIVFKYTVFILIWSHYHLIYIDNPHKHNCNCNYNCSKFRPDHIMKHLSHASILDCNKFGWYRPNVLKPHFAQFLKIKKSYVT